MSTAGHDRAGCAWYCGMTGEAIVADRRRLEWKRWERTIPWVRRGNHVDDTDPVWCSGRCADLAVGPLASGLATDASTQEPEAGGGGHVGTNNAPAVGGKPALLPNYPGILESSPALTLGRWRMKPRFVRAGKQFEPIRRKRLASGIDGFVIRFDDGFERDIGPHLANVAEYLGPTPSPSPTLATGLTITGPRQAAVNGRPCRTCGGRNPPICSNCMGTGVDTSPPRAPASPSPPTPVPADTAPLALAGAGPPSGYRPCPECADANWYYQKNSSCWSCHFRMHPNSGLRGLATRTPDWTPPASAPTQDIANVPPRPAPGPLGSPCSICGAAWCSHPIAKPPASVPPEYKPSPFTVTRVMVPTPLVPDLSQIQRIRARDAIEQGQPSATAAAPGKARDTFADLADEWDLLPDVRS